MKHGKGIVGWVAVEDSESQPRRRQHFDRGKKLPESEFPNLNERTNEETDETKKMKCRAATLDDGRSNESDKRPSLHFACSFPWLFFLLSVVLSFPSRPTSPGRLGILRVVVVVVVVVVAVADVLLIEPEPPSLFRASSASRADAQQRVPIP